MLFNVNLLGIQEHGGDLNEAVDAHFSEGDRTMSVLSFFFFLVFMFSKHRVLFDVPYFVL